MGRSPIEIMIDQACGFTEVVRPRPLPQIKIACPVCLKEDMTVRRNRDPKRAAVLEVPCPDCSAGMGETVEFCYRDAAGQPIPFRKR